MTARGLETLGGSGMRRLLLSRKAVSTTVLVLFLVAGGLVATIGLAAASGRSLTVSPSDNLQSSQPVAVTGTGFTHRSLGAVLECNLTQGEPLYSFTFHGVPQTVPVGCTRPKRTRTSASGVLGPLSLDVVTGTLGAADAGTDSAGNPASVDSALYPCPPTTAQIAAGASCVIEFRDNRGQVATTPVSFFDQGGTTTTVTPCELPVTGIGTNPNLTPPGTPTLTMSPGACLVGGTVVSLTGSGDVANSVGSFLECNSDPDQPTVDLLGHPIPVSCSNPIAQTPGPGLVTTLSNGGLGPYDFTIVQGVVGPPSAPTACTTDSSGGSPIADAADYPCPPTPAQVAAGDICLIDFHDAGGDVVSVPIYFASSP